MALNNEDLLEKIVKRQLVVNRFESNLLNYAEKTVDNLAKEIKPIILRYDEINNRQVASQVISDISPILEGGWGDIQQYTFQELEELKNEESRYTAQMINNSGAEEQLDQQQANMAVTGIEIGAAIVVGITLSNLFARTYSASNQLIGDAIRQGVLFSQTPNQIVKSIVGGKENKRIVPGLLPNIKNKMGTAIKTATVKTTNLARDGIYLVHPSIKGKMQISVFDSRTSDICKAYGGKVWTTDNKPVGHQLPWNGGPPRHPNCRSTIAPISDLNKIPKGFDFEAWFKKQPKAFQEEALGKTKAEMFRKGQFSMSDLVDQRQRPLTVKELKEQFGE